MATYRPPMAENNGPEAESGEPFDAAAAHKVFSTEAFNSAWDFIEKADRTGEDEEEMISLAHASAWHWTMREDVRPKNLAISAWQLSRVYAEAGRFDESDRYARKSLAICEENDVGPVFTGYAYEALARLAKETDDLDKRDEWLELGRAQAELVEDKLDRSRLISDLDAVAG